jgi:hypothetical protein
MAHCPSTVAGASTKIDDAPGGVAVTVTAKDDAAAKEVRARAAFLAQSSKNDAQPVAHNGGGNGGGVYGRCPVVMRNTTLTVSDVEGGAKIVVVPRDAKEKDWLGRESRERLAESEMPGASGAGVGKMAHCPNAVKGATTSIADAPDAVKITVTAKDDVATKEIRDRALKIVAAAKATAKGVVKHDGNGDGGGGFGRCPIVLKDTSVDEKDAPGGAVFTVKPKNAKDLSALKKQVVERSAKFEPR